MPSAKGGICGSVHKAHRFCYFQLKLADQSPKNPLDQRGDRMKSEISRIPILLSRRVRTPVLLKKVKNLTQIIVIA